jgi:transposase-like protein
MGAEEDGAKALQAAIKRVFGARAEVQRCQIHKWRNVKQHLPESCQKDYDRRIRNGVRDEELHRCESGAGEDRAAT